MNEKPKLLYIDDEPMNLELFTLNFQAKYSVITADTGQKGLKILEDYQDIHYVISDMRMPKMNGVEFITLVKERFPDVACFILTGFNIDSQIQEALSAKLINKHFCKPLNIEEIESSLAQFSK